MKYINCTEINKYKAAELPKQAQFARQFVSPDFGYCIRGHICNMFIIIRGEGVSNHLMLFIKFVTKQLSQNSTNLCFTHISFSNF